VRMGLRQDHQRRRRRARDPRMSVNEQAASFGRLVAKCQNAFDIGFLRQQNVRTGSIASWKRGVARKWGSNDRKVSGSGHSGSRIDRIWVTPRPW
jgi:hypothetical protein